MNPPATMPGGPCPPDKPLIEGGQGTPPKGDTVTVLTVWVPGTPQPQGSKRVYNGRPIDSNAKTLRPWRQAITAAANQALLDLPQPWPHTAPMVVTLECRFPRLKAHYTNAGQVKPGAPRAKTTRPDIDKLARAALDALTDAAVWADDAQVVELAATKTYGREPGLYALIAPMTSQTPGGFDPTDPTEQETP